MSDPASLTISGLALGFSFASFAWQHLRKVDSAICTLVANEVSDRQSTFQFSIANLGTRPALVRDIQVEVFSQPELFGEILGKSSYPSGSLPQVVKAGEIISVQIETKLNLDEINAAAKLGEKRGLKSGVVELYFVAKVTIWNPEGKRFIGTKHIANSVKNYGDNSFHSETFNDRSFQVSKQFGFLGSERFEKICKKLREDLQS
jgi:hypothetical protein